MADAIAILRHVVGLQQLDGEVLLAAKVSGIGSVSVQDAILILRFFVGLIKYEDLPMNR